MALFHNQATLSYNGAVTSSNIVTGEYRQALTATKTAVTDTYTVGGTVTYVISIVNTAATAVTGVTVTDNLGAYPFGTGQLVPLTYVDGSMRLFIDGVPQPAPTVTAGDTLTVTGLTVPAQGSAMLIYETEVNGYAPPAAGSEITNTASVAGTQQGAVTVTETVTAESQVELAIVKSMSPQIVTENGQLTYTFVIRNSGSQPADEADALSVTDTFDPILTDLAVTLDTAVMPKDIFYTYDIATGVFTTAPGQITVPAATYTQDETTGTWSVIPGETTLTVTGTV